MLALEQDYCFSSKAAIMQVLKHQALSYNNWCTNGSRSAVDKKLRNKFGYKWVA
jgi:hypothetical protein